MITNSKTKGENTLPNINNLSLLIVNVLASRVLANYLIWKVVFQSIKTLDKKFDELYNDFHLQTRPLKRNTKRWKLCLNLIGANMKIGMTSLYLINDKQREKKRILVKI